MNTYRTKNGKTVVTEIFSVEEDIVKSRLFDSYVMQAKIDNNVVGYAKIVFTSTEKARKLLEPFDFFIYKFYGSNESIVQSYENKDYKFLIDKLALRDLGITKNQLEEMSEKSIKEKFQTFKENINETYQSQFNYFINYWVNKPNIELIRVFSEKDLSFSDLSKKGHPFTNRIPENWQGQGIGLFLYESIANWCKNNNLELYASTNQTEDGKRMWKIMERHPKFSIIMTQLLKYTSNGQILNTINRPKLSLA